MSRMKMIVKCERCQKEQFITLDGDLTASIIYLIRSNSDFRDVSVFGTTMLLCFACQAALEDFANFRELQADAFIADKPVKGRL